MSTQTEEEFRRSGGGCRCHCSGTSACPEGERKHRTDLVVGVGPVDLSEVLDELERPRQ